MAIQRHARARKSPAICAFGISPRRLQPAAMGSMPRLSSLGTARPISVVAFSQPQPLDSRLRRECPTASMNMVDNGNALLIWVAIHAANALRARQARLQFKGKISRFLRRRCWDESQNDQLPLAAGLVACGTAWPGDREAPREMRRVPVRGLQIFFACLVGSKGPCPSLG
jgi:hypothetical protein